LGPKQLKGFEKCFFMFFCENYPRVFLAPFGLTINLKAHLLSGRFLPLDHPKNVRSTFLCDFFLFHKNAMIFFIMHLVFQSKMRICVWERERERDIETETQWERVQVSLVKRILFICDCVYLTLHVCHSTNKFLLM